MGLFYANMTVYRPLRQPLLAALRRLRVAAFVSPTVYGHSVIFDKASDEQSTRAIEQLGLALTQELSCAGLAAALHDDDVLYLWLFSKGRIRDRYDSLPGYFDPNAEPGAPEGGNSRLLCEAFDRPDHQKRVEQLLRANLLDDELPEVPGELERHKALAAELGLPPFVAGLGYSVITGGYVPKEFQAVRFETVHQTQ
jgi:hypothetical protein